MPLVRSKERDPELARRIAEEGTVLRAVVGSQVHGLNNAGMNQATGYLANDLASQQITVNTLVPGLVGTEGRQAWAENMAKQQNVTTEEFLASFCKRMGILSGRWATMDEVADSVLFLASDRGRYYNGAKIIMDGGLNVNVRPA